MKSHRKVLTLHVPQRTGFVNITTEPREQIFYGEFDGRRDKRILIKVIGE